jgi:hypothetical protein
MAAKGDSTVKKNRAVKTVDTHTIGMRQVSANDLRGIRGGAGNAAIDFAIKPPATA